MYSKTSEHSIADVVSLLRTTLAELAEVKHFLAALQSSHESLKASINQSHQQTLKEIEKLRNPTKKHYTKLTSMPQEVVAQIMSWIFPYDVWQFRKLSKSFNELISSSRFAALNLNRFAPIPDYSVDFSWAPTCWDMLSFHSPVSYQSEYARKNLTHFIKLIWLREIRAEVEIPASWFPHLTNLERLEWDECSLVGPIPEEIGSLQVFSNLICH